MNYKTTNSLTKVIRAGEDINGELRPLGISRIDFKMIPDPDNSILIIENTFHAKGGPAKHLHYDQDEYFYAIEGEFQFEIGEARFELHPGDSIIGPRKVPHVWAFSGGSYGKILIVFSPAGLMEKFFSEVSKANAMPPLDPALWRDHGMELLGPPLKIE